MTFSPRRLFINAGSNTAAFVANLLVSLVLAPIVLRSLGDARYGWWSFVESFIAYLTLFDLGVAAALVRFVPRAVARADDDDLTRLYSASLTFFAAGGLLALAVGFAFSVLVLDRFLPPSLRDEVHSLFVILVANFAITLPLSVYPALLDGFARFTYKSAVRTAMLVLRVPLTLFVLQFPQRLVLLGLVLTACNLTEHLLLAFAAHRAAPRMRFRPSMIDRATVGRVARYSGNAVTAMFSGRLAFHTDAFVIGAALGAAAITPFALSAKLVEMSKSILRSATTTLTSAFSALEANDDHHRLRSTFLTGSRMAWYAGLTAQAGLLLLGKPFLRLWVGVPYAEAGAPVLFALASVFAASVAQSVASRVLYGTGRLRGFAVATLAEGLTNLALSIALVSKYGIAGVAIGTAVPHALFCIYVITSVCRQLEIPARDYFGQLARPILVAIVPAALWWQLVRRGIAGWPELFAGAGLGLLAAALAGSLAEGVLVRSLRRALSRITSGKRPTRVP